MLACKHFQIALNSIKSAGEADEDVFKMQAFDCTPKY